MKTWYLKNLILSNAPLKIICLFLGYSFWYIVSSGQIISLSIYVPISFYNLATNLKVDAPEKIHVTIKGRRIDLSALEKGFLAAHINAANFKPGRELITINARTLFLPDAVKLVYCNPSNLVIFITEKNNTKDRS